MIDVSVLRLLLLAITGWLDRQEREALAYPGRDPATGGAHGGGQSDVGLHADSGCPEECWAPGRAIDDRAHPEGPRSATRAAASSLVADLSASALASGRRGRLLYD